MNIAVQHRVGDIQLARRGSDLRLGIAALQIVNRVLFLFVVLALVAEVILRGLRLLIVIVGFGVLVLIEEVLIVIVLVALQEEAQKHREEIYSSIQPRIFRGHAQRAGNREEQRTPLAFVESYDAADQREYRRHDRQARQDSRGDSEQCAPVH